MAKLNQVIAIEKGVKSRAYADISALDKAAQKEELFNGFTKTYEKKADDGEDFPQERKRVQYVVPDVLKNTERLMTEMFAVEARKDWSNMVAKGNVVVDGVTLLPDAPVSFLLFLEKQLTDLRTLVGRLPVLDAAEDWTKDANSGLFKSNEIRTHRTKKVQKPIVLYDATAEHPAQTQLITEDDVVGYWVQVKQSGAMPKPDKDVVLQNIEKVLVAVKTAREEANNTEEVSPPEFAGKLFGLLLGD